MALPFEVGHANNTRGLRSADGPRPQMCLADPRTVHIREKICRSGSADIHVRSPHTSVTNDEGCTGFDYFKSSKTRTWLDLGTPLQLDLDLGSTCFRITEQYA